jgi:hypothetical protein
MLGPVLGRLRLLFCREVPSFVGFGPFGSPTDPPQAEHQARALPAGHLLINH